MRFRTWGLASAVVAALLASALVHGPLPAAPPGDADEIAALLAKFDQGDADSAAALAKRGEAAVAGLVERLVGADAKLAESAGAVLVTIGAPAVPKLAESMKSAPVPGRVAIANALGGIAAGHDEAVAPLAASLGDADPAVREAAARGIGAAGPRAKPSAAGLGPLLADPDPLVRLAAADASIRTGVSTPTGSAWQVLMAAMSDKDAGVRAGACPLVAGSGAPAGLVVPALLKATKDPDAGVRLAAVRGLVEQPAREPRIVEALARIALAGDPIARALALEAFPKFSNETPAEAIHLGGALRGDRLKRRGTTRQVDAAIASALDWLARHQSADGRWDADDFDSACKLNRCDGPGYPQFDVGVTGLALLAFLGAGETHLSGPHKVTVARGIAFLIRSMSAQGSMLDCGKPIEYEHEIVYPRAPILPIPGRPTPKPPPSDDFTEQTAGAMYNQAIATVALCEAYMMSGEPSLAVAAGGAARFVLRAKSPNLGWHYLPGQEASDTSVTGWMAWAVAVARAADVASAAHMQWRVGKSERNLDDVMDEAVAWIDRVTEEEFGRTGYRLRGSPPVRVVGFETKFPVDQSESLTAEALLVRVLAGHTAKDDAFIPKGAELVMKKLPKWDVDRGCIDFYAWFFGSTAMRQIGGTQWKKWNDALTAALLTGQRGETDRDEHGSWDAVDAWSVVGGRVYSTAICCMALEAPWRMDQLPKAPPKSK